jgi:hypothetical protein
MENENFTNQEQPSLQEENFLGRHNLNRVTPISRYLAIFLMIALPFIGGYLGYVFTKEEPVATPIVDEKPLPPQKDATLKFQKRTDYSGTAAPSQDVSFQYESASSCDPTDMDGFYSLDFGDGNSIPADCKGMIIHTYKNQGVYTATYQKDYEVVASVEVPIDGVVDTTDLDETPSVSVEAEITSTGAYAILVEGSITPPQNCTGNERMEVELRFHTNNSVSYELATCEIIPIKMGTQYSNDTSTAFPELRLRWLDARTNTWTYQELARFKVDFTNPIEPIVTKLR